MPELEPVTLQDRSSALTATPVPGAGMIGVSLAEDGREFLGQRRGLGAYLADAKTMGIPILYPWANRLGDTEYSAGGTTVSLAGLSRVRTDPHGAPMHGVLAGYPGWTLTERSADSLTAAVDYDTDELLEAFPFRHRLTQRITLADRTLSIATTVEPAAGVSVPLCFGYHPYFTIPGVPRAQWELRTPAMRHLPVDDRGIPTGAHEPLPAASAPLGDRVLDDGFDQVAPGSVFTVTGGDHRIDVSFDAGYPAAQLFAPDGDDLIAIEPMAAPTDALRRGGYRTAEKAVTARFSVRIDRYSRNG